MNRYKIFGLLIMFAFMVLPAVTLVGAMNSDFAVRAKPDKPPGKPDKPTDPTPDPTPDPGTGDGIVKKYALVIGISDYASDANDLTYCDDDARDWRDYLVSQGYTVNMILDRQATADNILNALQNLANQEDADDWVAFCYSGHGYYYRTYRESTLVSSDEYLILESTIEAITDTFESQHVFAFLDCCNAGTFSKMVNNGWVAGIGSKTNSYTYDGTAQMANGIYTYYAMEAIEVGYTSAEDICNYAAQKFNAATPGTATTYDMYSGVMDI